VNITVSGYNRPRYLERTLAALSQCDGVEDCNVMVLLDPCGETPESVALAHRYGFTPCVYSERVGCNGAIFGGFAVGFRYAESDYHVHLEDDTVPCRDSLRWFAWARDRYRDDQRVFSVSGYQRIGNGNRTQSTLREWFTPWGWATWRDRWGIISTLWQHDPAVSWDVRVNYVLRAGRLEAHPTVSRIQNIGGEMGTHVPSPEWHAANHHVPVTADDLPGDPVREWSEIPMEPPR
jgi:hypothetical protein